MKNIVIIFILFLSISLQAQRKPKIKGNRNVIEVRENLSTFNAIQLNDNLNITLEKRSSSGYTLKTDENLIDVLKFEVIDSTLFVSSSYRITSKKRLDITINYETLGAITLKNGKVEVKSIISTDKLYMNTAGSSELKLAVNAPIVAIHMEGNSDGDFKIDSDSLSVNLKDKVNLSIYGSGKTNDVMLDNNASLNIEGTTDNLSLHLIGNTNFKGTMYEAGTVIAKLEESSKARINALDTINLYSRGSSKTFLYGNPVITISEFLDTSQLHKEKN